MDDLRCHKVVTPIRRLGLSRRSSKSPITPSVERLITSGDITSICTPTKIEHMVNKENAYSLKSPALHKKDDELNDAVILWKNGCKEALLALQSWISEKEGKSLTCKFIAEQLGVWHVIRENFHDDSDLVCSDDDG